MATEPAENYLQRNGYGFKRRGNELLLNECPACGKEHKMSVNNLTWAFQCFVCNEKGREYKLKRLFGDVYEHQDTREEVTLDIDVGAFAADPKAKRHVIEVYQDDLFSEDGKQALEYLHGRGFSNETIRSCGIGWSSVAPATSRESDGGWLILPTFVKWRDDGTFDHDGLAMIKARTVDPAPKQYVRQAGGHTRLFQPFRIDVTKPVIVCAGELDAVAVVESGYKNVVATTAGEGAWSDVFSRQLQDCERVIIVYDNDRTGEEGARKVAEELGEHRCHVYKLPSQYNDANDALIGGWLKQNIQTIANSQIGIERQIVKPSDLMHLVTSDEYASKGFSTGWPSLDEMIGGVRIGEVIVVTGETGTGKSTFVSQLALNLAQSEVPTLFLPLEIGTVRQAEKWAMQLTYKDPSELEESEFDALNYDLDAIPLHILDHFGSIGAEALRNTIALARRKLGLRVLIVDHIHFSVASDPDRERLDLEALVMMLNEIAVTMKLAVVVVAHPNNRGAGDGDGRIVQLGDLKGSSAIKQVASLVLSVWRDRGKERKQDRDDLGRTRSIIYSMKSRSVRANEGAVPMLFDARSSRFHQVEEEKSRVPETKVNVEDLTFDF